jgi:hypothetical protein
MSIRSSGTTDTILSTRNTLTNLANKAISESLIGIRLMTTTRVSKTFQPDLKKCFLFSSTRNLKDISNKKKIVIKVSNSDVIEIALLDNWKVLAPISRAEIMITHITANSKNLLFFKLVKDALRFDTWRVSDNSIVTGRF